MSTVQIGRQLIDEDPNVRAYHVRMILTEQPREQALRNEPVDNPVLDAALHIPGVSVVVLMPYTLVIHKVPVYEWTEIEPTVKALLASFLVPLSDELLTR